MFLKVCVVDYRIDPRQFDVVGSRRRIDPRQFDIVGARRSRVKKSSQNDMLLNNEI